MVIIKDSKRVVGDIMWTTISKYKDEVIAQKSNDSIFQILKSNNNYGKVFLDNSSVIVQSDYLSYIKGTIEVMERKQEVTLNNFKDVLFSNKRLIKTHSKTILEGDGEIVFQKVDEILILLELIDEEISVWDEMFYCCEGVIDIEEFTEQLYYGDDELDEEKDMIRLSGCGLVILKLPVISEDDIIVTKIFKDRIINNHNCVILRNNNIQCSIEKFLHRKVNVYSGSGEIWQVPINKLYCDNKVIEQGEDEQK